MQYWDVSRVTSMSEVFVMFYNKKQNNCNFPDINGLDVSRVTTFVSIFWPVKN